MSNPHYFGYEDKYVPDKRPMCPVHTDMPMKYMGVQPTSGPLIVHTPKGTFINPDILVLQCPICKLVSIIPLLTLYQRKETV